MIFIHYFVLFAIGHDHASNFIIIMSYELSTVKWLEKVVGNTFGSYEKI